MKPIVKELFLFLAMFIYKGDAQCTFPSTLADTTWHDNTYGTQVFTSTQMTGLSVTAYGVTMNEWQCVYTDDTTLIVGATSPITFGASNFYAYACLTLTKLSDYSYIYYQRHAMEPNAGQQRLKMSASSTLSTVAEICDYTVTVPTLEFHLLLKQGNELNAAITCPNSLLFKADYQYQDTLGTQCTTNTDLWDGCTNNNQMTFDYTQCSQQMMYSAGGVLSCIAEVSDCVAVYNHDATITGTAQRLSCLCYDSTTVSVAPGNCTSDQTATAYPTGPDGATAIGYLVNITSTSETCSITTTAAAAAAVAASDSGSNAGLIAGVVVAVLLIIVIVVIIAVLYWRYRKKNENRVFESSKPIIADEEKPHVETIGETARSREPTMVSRQGSKLTSKSLQRNATLNSIGLTMKSGQTARPDEAKATEQTKAPEEPRLKLFGKDLSFLVCCPKKTNEGDQNSSKKTMEGADGLEKAKESNAAEKTETEKGSYVLFCCPNKTAEGTEGSDKEKGSSVLFCFPKKTAEDAEEGKGRSFLLCCPKKTEEEKVPLEETAKDEEETSDQKKKTKGTRAIQTDKKKATSTEDTKKSPKANQAKPNSPKKKGGEKSKAGAPLEKEKTTLSLLEVPGSEVPTELLTQRSVVTEKGDSPRASTPKSGRKDDKAKSPKLGKKTPPKGKVGKGATKKEPEEERVPTPVTVTAVPVGLVKPEENKKNEWTFLQCCYGKRSPEPDPGEDENIQVVEEDVKTIKAKKKPAPKSKGAAAKKPAGKKAGGKKKGEKSKENGVKAKPHKNGTVNGIVKPEITVEDVDDMDEVEAKPPQLERTKSMPEKVREKTALSLKDAEKVKVDVYIPDDKTTLQLKDTVTVVKGSNGELEKAKTSLGITRPASSASSVKPHSEDKNKDKGKAGKGDKKRKGGEKGSKDKKAKKKKK